jgi:hypothetical protein
MNIVKIKIEVQLWRVKIILKLKMIFCSHYGNYRLLLTPVILALYLTFSISSSCTLVLIDYDFLCSTFLDMLTLPISYTPLNCGIKNLMEHFLHAYLHILDLLLQSQVVLRPYLACLSDIISEPWTDATVTYTSPIVGIG